MSKTTIPSGYRMPLSNNELQRAIELIHQEFQHSLCVRLNLHRVSAPLFVDGRTGLNDDLNGVERPVSFDIPDVGTDGQVEAPGPEAVRVPGGHRPLHQHERHPPG